MISPQNTPEEYRDDKVIFDCEPSSSNDVIADILNPTSDFRDDEDDMITYQSKVVIPQGKKRSIYRDQLTNDEDYDQAVRDKFDDDFDNDVDSHQDAYIEVEASDVYKAPEVTPLQKAKVKPEAKGKSDKYVDNGSSAMLVAERFIKRNPMFKLNGRIYLYYFRGKPCYSEINDEDLCEALFKQHRELLMSESPSLASQIVKAIRLQLPNTPKELIRKAESRYVAVKNGILDLEKDRLIEHTPKKLLRYYLRVDVDLDDSNCPTFASFIKDATGGRGSVIISIYEALAYSIFPTDFRKAIPCIIGPKNSGKSVINRFLESMFSDGCVTNESICDLGKNFRSGNYAEARLNIDGDLTNNALGEKEVGILKRITGGDRIVSEVKYQQAQYVDADCKFLICSNHKIVLRSSDDAFLYRLHIIPFDYPVPRDKMDLQLNEKLELEKTGIFTVIYKWYRRLKNNGYQFKDCVDVNEYCIVCERSNGTDTLSVMDEFFYNYFEVTGEDSDFIPSSKIEELARNYCRQNQIEYLIPGFAQKFSNFIRESYSEEIRYARRGNNKARGYCGIRLIDIE